MYEQLREILSSKFQIESANITPDSTMAGMELDSLDAVELSMVIEQEFDAKVSDTELGEAHSLAEIVSLVERRSARV